MKNAEEIIAGFYHYIKNSEVQDKRNNEAFIHKLNYLILYNPTPTEQDWVASMVAFATKSTHGEGFEDMITILREHYNSLVPENKMLTVQAFESAITKQGSSKTMIHPEL